MKSIMFIILSLVVVLASSYVTVNLIERQHVLQVETYLMDVRVTDAKKIGFNVDSDGFHFGSLNRGSTSRRDLIINKVEKDVLVSITKKGEMGTWIANPNNFVIEKGRERNLSLVISIPTDAKLGNYTGEVIITLKKV